MNSTLTIYARDFLKENLRKCSFEQRMLFKRMYSHDKPKLPMEEVINEMDEDKLDWAMVQVQRILDKKGGR